MEPSRKPFVRTPPAAGALHTKGGLLLKREVVCRALTSHGDSEDRVGHHPEQEERQIDARELVTGPRVFDARRHQKLRGESKQHGPRDDRDSEIDGVEGGREHERDARDRDDRRREGDGPHGRSFVRDRGKHRESRPPVVLAAPERESPEMARGPEEYEEGDEDGRKADGIRCGSGSRQGGKGTRESSDHDVAHVGPLQAQSVDADIHDETEADHQGRQEIDPESRDDEAEGDEAEAEFEGVRGRLNPMLRQGSSLRPPHDRIKVSVEIVVRGAGAGGPEESGDDQKGEPTHVDVDTGRGDVPRGGDKQEKRVDPEFHQLDIVCEGHGERSSRANRPAFLTLCRRAVLTWGRRLFPKSRATVPIAIRPNRTILAAWVPRLAQRASVGDDREVPSLAFARWSPVLERAPNRLVILAAGELPSARDAGDVRVDGERRTTASHCEDDVGGLGTDTGKGHQFRPCPFGREAEDALDPAVPLVSDRGRRRADPWGLLTRKARVPNRPRDFLIGSGREPIGRDGTDLEA